MSLGCSQCPVTCCRAESGPTVSLAVDKDLGEAPHAGGAVQCLASEGCPGLLHHDLRLPHEHMALAEDMISCALTSSAHPGKVGDGRERNLAHVLANIKTACFFLT